MQVDTPQKTYQPVKQNTTSVSPTVPVKPVLDEKEQAGQPGKRRKRRPRSETKEQQSGPHFDGFA
ncbi:MAG: hypothetical protein JKY89_08555 [Immundisolibacteraceae bacterium]|nr:hypothetical protein [Immundisolibacteraceae bacterium]